MKANLFTTNATDKRGIDYKLVGRYGILAFTAAVILFPLLWMVSTALKTGRSVTEFPPTLIPEAPSLEPTFDAIATGPWAQWFFNTFLLAGGAVVLTLFVTVPAAYALSRWDFFGKRAIYFSVMGLLMIPTQILLLPLFIEFAWVNFGNNFLALVIAYSVLFSAFVTFLLLGFFRTLPNDVEDAARVAGISEFKIFTRIVLPLAKPSIGIAGIFVFIYSWNEYLWALIFLENRGEYTISIGLTIFKGIHGNVAMNQLMAMSILASAPILVLFILTQERFIEGITTGFEF